MKKYILYTCFVAIVITLLTACQATVKGEKVSDPGKTLYYSKCSFCHRPFPPGSRSPGEWRDVLDEMAPRAGLNKSERALIFRFLTGEGKGDRQ